MKKEPFIGNIEELTLKGNDFRKVIYTGTRSQLVLMSLMPGEEIGTETHERVDQFFRFENGSGKAIVSGKEYELKDGTALVVPAGLEHNIINTGAEDLKLYTIYSPANHIDGIVHETKIDAINDTADEAFGESVK